MYQALDVNSSCVPNPYGVQVFGLLAKPLIDHLFPYNEDLMRNDSLIEDQGLEEDHSLSQPLLLPECDKSELSVANLSSLPMLAMPNRDGMGPSRSKIGAFFRASTQDVHDLWKRFDLKFMRPYFGGRGFVPAALNDDDDDDVEEGGGGGRGGGGEEGGDDIIIEREEGVCGVMGQRSDVGVIREEEEGEGEKRFERNMSGRRKSFAVNSGLDIEQHLRSSSRSVSSQNLVAEGLAESDLAWPMDTSRERRRRSFKRGSDFGGGVVNGVWVPGAGGHEGRMRRERSSSEELGVEREGRERGRGEGREGGGG